MSGGCCKCFNIVRTGISGVIIWIFSVTILHAQVKDILHYVNPFIGTASSDVITQWGSEGFTYPGAVAPSGYIQLTPETSVTDRKGYYYQDSSIYFFSCIDHLSGYPNGSSGRLVIMPIHDAQYFSFGKSKRPFRHQNESASPGYYGVLLEDDSTVVEATASERAGMFRFTFAAGNVPRIFIADMGEIDMRSKQVFTGDKFNSTLHFSEEIVSKEKTDDGYILTFSSSMDHSKIITLKLSTSTVSLENAEDNVKTEFRDLSFDQVKAQTQSQWLKKLSMIEVNDSNEVNKTIFYTALYHSLLIPWIISDVDGRYKGRDQLIHKTSGKNEYGGFSPWDTYRSLHPLLCLLFPEAQNDMILSMLDVYQQTGFLPIEPMTGNHAVPVIVDSYLKGITSFDKHLAYEAMKKSIDIPPFKKSDLETYHTSGYLSSLYSESVTRTLEYAYDDWSLAQFAKFVMHQQNDYERLLQRSYSYRNLLHPQQLFFLPRNQDEFKVHPGNFGYKEGDKWVYSYALPNHSDDLINLFGGSKMFSDRLDSALTYQKILFDNETTFHIPYLFNKASHPSLTQKWVSTILQSRFKNTPGGLPGNDDLGSMSSWYVFSAMGFYPTTAAKPVYDVGSPVFKLVTIHLSNGKNFSIETKNLSQRNRYIKSLLLNDKKYKHLEISHEVILKGGELVATMTDKPSEWFVMNSSKEPEFTIANYSVSKKIVKPNEIFWIRYSLFNNGAMGTKATKFFINNVEYTTKNLVIKNNETLLDSVACQLYTLGKIKVRIDKLKEFEIEVVDPKLNGVEQVQLDELLVLPIIKTSQLQRISYTIKNVGWQTQTFTIPMYLDNACIMTDTIRLKGGAKRRVEREFSVTENGFHAVRIHNRIENFKVYDNNANSLVLNLSLLQNNNLFVIDSSGFNNHGKVIVPDTNHQDTDKYKYIELNESCFVEIPNSRSLDISGESITVIAWIYATKRKSNTADLVTKGDHHVLQINGNRSLNFFAGGWGRGECNVALPDNWQGNWHHVAGVCDGTILQVYVDGELKGTTKLQSHANLSNESKWNIGRNEEFPSERIFDGYIDKVKIYTAALSTADIQVIFNRESLMKVERK
jgi:putative alpha-1,2-mannosidase